MKQEKTVANSRFATERPQAREYIRREKLIPDVVISHGKLFWDGWTARRPDGRRVMLPDAFATQLLVMTKAGEWGDLSRVILDWNKHTLVRDAIERKTPHSHLDSREWQPSGKTRGASA
jgi:hypothetical protein